MGAHIEVEVEPDLFCSMYEVKKRRLRIARVDQEQLGLRSVRLQCHRRQVDELGQDGDTGAHRFARCGQMAPEADGPRQTKQH